MYSSFFECQTKLSGVEAIDFYLAKQLCEIAENDQQPLLFHLVLATVSALHNGHTCLAINAIANTSCWLDEDAEFEPESKNINHSPNQLSLNQQQFDFNAPEISQGFTFPTLEKIAQCLAHLPISPNDNAALVYHENRLYLRRYWLFETELVTAIKPRLHDITTVTPANMTFLNTLFPASEHVIDWQKIAVINALNKNLVIIAGGPGTGKTTTVTKLLVSLQQLANNTLNIVMAAPTGKAAQRLTESVKNSKTALFEQGMIDEQCFASIPNNASTIHRLLGVKFNSLQFHHDKTKPLIADVLLLDEISMVDLPLMARLFRALTPQTRVILLGDVDQLPSVAAGSILADLAPSKVNCFSQTNIDYLGFSLSSKMTAELEKAAQVTTSKAYDHVAILQHSYRFNDDGGIGKLAKLVIQGNSIQSWQLLNVSDKELQRNHQLTWQTWLTNLTEQFYIALFKASAIETAFNILANFRILSPLRQGEYGVTAINQFIEQYLKQRGFISSPTKFYRGQPIMITENHHKLQLFNGDIGICWPNEYGILMAMFIDNDNQIKSYSTARLPKFETVYAMTIHKTQGSEFDNVAIILPDHKVTMLTRELIYTGITRAKKQLFVHSNEAVWLNSVNTKVIRHSGLAERLFT